MSDKEGKMQGAKSLTIVELLCHLSRHLSDLRTSADHEQLRKLWSAITEVLDAAYECEDQQTAALLEEMGDAVRDSLMGVEWKSNIPSEETIRELYGTRS